MYERPAVYYVVKDYDSYNLPANVFLPPIPPLVGVIKSFNTSLLEHNLEMVALGWSLRVPTRKL